MEQALAQSITLRRMTIEDLDWLTEAYRAVEIGRHNLAEKLTPGENSFENCGGMFLINSESRNRELLSSTENVLIGGELDGELCGMIWFSPAEIEYPYDQIQYFPEREAEKHLVEKLVRMGKIYPGQEVIVTPKAKGKMVFELFAALLNSGFEHGFSHMIGEVYRLDGYEDETGYHVCDMLNMPSFMTLKKTGGIHLGTAPERVIRKEGITYHITPQVFLWQISDSVAKIRNHIKEKWG